MAKIDLGSRLDPQMARAMAKSQALAPGFERLHELPVEEIRRLYREERRFWNEDRRELPKVVGQEIAGPAGPVPIRIYYPSEARPLPALVFAHGGGWIMGDLDTHDKIMRLLALRAGVAVVGIDYSLSPERKFPVAIEECVALLATLEAAGADWGLDPGRLAMGGDSAGANLTLGAALSIRPTKPSLLKAGLLYYGAFGLEDSVSRRLYGGDDDGMSAKDLDFYSSNYLRGEADRDDPRRHSLRADLAGLPPLFIAAAELDPIHDDSIALAALLEARGGPYQLTIYDGVLHGFLHYSRMVDKASKAIDDGAAFLRRVFSL